MSKLAQSLRDYLSQSQSAQVDDTGDRLLHNLRMTIARNAVAFEWLIKKHCRKPPKAELQAVLRWALAESFLLHGVPAPSVVNVAVAFVRENYSSHEASFINAFLRNLLREAGEDGLESLLKNAPPHVQNNLPSDLWSRWCRNFGVEKSMQMASLLQRPAQTVVRVREWPPASSWTPPEWLRPCPAPEWASWAHLYEVQDAPIGAISALMSTGECYIQDPSTLLAPTLLAVQPGEHVADLCCAPGGKSRCIAEFLRGEGSLWCADVAQDKLPRVRQNLAPFANFEVHCLNAATGTLAAEQWDAILLDVPCSNTGVIRRRPDVRAGFSTAKFKALLQLQAQILDNCAKAVKAKGRLVYSTCSIEPEENQMQVARFLTSHPDWHCPTQRTILPTASHDGCFCALLTHAG